MHPSSQSDITYKNWSSTHADKLLNSLLICAVLYAVIGLAVDLRHTMTYGGSDLRHRVVGARVMLHHYDPYFFKWHVGLPDEWLDPTDRNVPISQVTVPPTVLSVHAAIATFPYRLQRVIWLFVQWALFIATVMPAAGCATTSLQKKVVWIAALLFVSGSFFWRLHVERGQIYVLYAFLIMLSFWFSQRVSLSNQLIGGIVLGLSISLRPILIVMGIPLLISRRWTTLGGAFMGALVGLGGAALVAGAHLWQSYFSAMNLSEQIYLGTYHCAVPITIGTFPSAIEGMTNLKSMLAVPTIDSSLAEIARRTGIHITSTILSLVYAGCIVCLLWILYGQRRIARTTTNEYIVGIYLALIGEFFLPAARYSYSDIIWLPFLSMVFIRQGLLKTIQSRTVILLLAGLICASTSTMLSYTSYTVFLSEIAVVCYGLIAILRLPASTAVSPEPNTEHPSSRDEKRARV